MTGHGIRRPPALIQPGHSYVVRVRTPQRVSASQAIGPSIPSASRGPTARSQAPARGHSALGIRPTSAQGLPKATAPQPVGEHCTKKLAGRGTELAPEPPVRDPHAQPGERREPVSCSAGLTQSRKESEDRECPLSWWFPIVCYAHFTKATSEAGALSPCHGERRAAWLGQWRFA